MQARQSNLKDAGKSISEKIPPAAGILLNHVPFRFRLGADYRTYFELAERLLQADAETKAQFSIAKFRKIYHHFRQNNPFYGGYLKQKGCNTDDIRNLEDIRTIPLITKANLREVPIENRSIIKHGYKKFNTGGTSGSPLAFFLEKSFYSREWSHMHFMWKKLGYKPTSTKITIRGKSVNGLYQYRFHQNEFLLNSYYSFSNDDYLSLLRVFRKYNTEFIHGYPSAIYNFLRDVSVNAPFLLEFLRKNIRGIMFSSEYPSPHFRDFIENLITKNTISWYGQTEGTVLAGEMYNKYTYIPFASYGFTEAVKVGDYYHLVGTSFDNFAAPFVRYDTEDLIRPAFNPGGLLESFEIAEGRLGEFVTDRQNKKISLTGLIFGRHHKLFDTANSIQVKQLVPGTLMVYYSHHSRIENPAELFDSTNLNMELQFKQVTEPFITPVGKTPLLIN